MSITSPLMDLFGRSPIRPLQKHMSKAQLTAMNLVDFFAAVFQQDWDAAKKQWKVIQESESEADKIKNDLRLHLPKGLFLPVARGDILQLLKAQESVANKAEDIAGLVMGRKIQFPAQIAPLYEKFLTQCLAVSEQAARAINELDELMESGFRGREIRVVSEMIQQLDELEHQSDAMQIEIRGALFDIEESLAPVEVIFLYKIIELTGDLADCAQEVGGRLHLLIAQ